tara:strand:- start:3828 stop:4007 length:180 start_codon:yes stop_codon:yes gene_type:complete
MKWFSRKLFAFLLGSVLLWFDKIDSYSWIVLASVYIGVQAGLDYFKVLNKKEDENNNSK